MKGHTYADAHCMLNTTQYTENSYCNTLERDLTQTLTYRPMNNVFEITSIGIETYSLIIFFSDIPPQLIIRQVKSNKLLVNTL